MKKIILVLFVFLFVVGCGSTTTNELDMDKASQAIEKRLNNMVKIEDSTLTDAYNLDLSKMEKWIFKQNEEGDLYDSIYKENN